MYLLKTELRGSQGQRVLSSLPCPESELTRWIAASQRQLHNRELSRLVRSSPTLFLIAVSRAVDCTAAPIQSMTQLVSRLEHCFRESQPVDTSLGHVIDIQKTEFDLPDWEQQYKDSIVAFLQAKNRKQLTKSLAGIVRHVNKQQLPKLDRSKKSSIKSLIDSMFADSFRIERLNKNATWPEADDESNCKNANSAIVGLIHDRLSRVGKFQDDLEREKLAAMKQLAYGASHEINNPLANIATRAQTMLADESQPDRRFQLAVIHEQAMRAHDMISDMMLFAHPPALRKESIDVRMMIVSLVRECESNLLPLVQSGATVTATIGKGVGRANLDPTQCKVALASLIQNAAEAMRNASGEIDIRVHQDDRNLCFSVSDNGVGVDEKVRRHLFDPFYSGREAGRGLGFGLSKSWRIAKLHEGSLTHRFDADELRTVFELRIPR